MILNKSLSIILSACFFMLLMLVASSIIAVFFKGRAVPFIGLFFVVVFYFLSRAFYNYLRNDELYKNNRKRTSDMPDEKYIVKGQKDAKKIFIIVWVIVILILAAISLWLYSINNGLV
ncbi:MAG: hypothetical protein E7Z77_04565 [Methanobrevibacter sp.]|uniref:hypothetical protein n=1 Tax=Methanobrevibacter sp. TaxID=66852 RepID=UPI0025E31BC9|nr:hypothetical protein [Methanobrevibacter sp.]MBE6508671.1 hypothetical protein [Methanobrevibacter sp.]